MDNVKCFKDLFESIPDYKKDSLINVFNQK